MKSFEEKLVAGYFYSKAPYPEEGLPREQRIDMRRSAREDQNRLDQEFKTAALEATGLTNHPKADEVFLFVDENAHGEYMGKFDLLRKIAKLVK